MSSNCPKGHSLLRRSTRRSHTRPLAPKDVAEESEGICALFGANFRQARLKARMTQAEVEQLTGMRQCYVAELELGLYDPTLDMMATLAEAVATEVHSLLRPPPKRG
jgi:hypothetical protein